MTVWKRRVLAVSIVLVLAAAGVLAFVEFGGSTSSGSGPGVSPALTAAPGPLVTVAGTVKQLLPNGDFVVNDRHTDYTIAIFSSTKIVNRAGAQVAKKLIRVAQSVQITGMLTGSTIGAQSVLVPTDLAQP